MNDYILQPIDQQFILLCPSMASPCCYQGEPQSCILSYSHLQVMEVISTTTYITFVTVTKNMLSKMSILLLPAKCSFNNKFTLPPIYHHQLIATLSLELLGCIFLSVFQLRVLCGTGIAMSEIISGQTMITEKIVRDWCRPPKRMQVPNKPGITFQP